MGFIFPIVFLLLICGLIYYLTKRVTKSFGLGKFWLAYSTILLLTFVSFFGSQILALSVTPFGRIVSNVAAFWLMAVLYGILSFAVIHLAGVFGNVKPKVQGISGIILTAGIILYGVLNSYSIRVIEVTVPIKGLENPMKIVHLTDIHLGNFRGKSFLTKVVEKANGLQPDLILHTGFI